MKSLVFFHPELTDTKTARPFSFSFNTSDYRILLMDQDQGRLFLGSREYLVALDMHNVNKEPLIVRRTPPGPPLARGPPSLKQCLSENPDPLARVRQEERGVSDDRERTTGELGRSGSGRNREAEGV